MLKSLKHKKVRTPVYNKSVLLENNVNIAEILKTFSNEIIGISVAGIVAVFLPKKAFIFLKEFVLFGARAILKHWKLNIVTLYFIIDGSLAFNSQMIITLLLILFPISVIADFYSISMKLNTKASLIVYGCFSTKDKEYLITDLDAENINENLLQKIKEIKERHFIFQSNKLDLNFIEIPKFLPLLLGYKGIKKLFEKYLNNGKQISSLFFINTNEKQLIPKLNYNPKNFAAGTEEFSCITSLLKQLSNNRAFTLQEVAEITFNIYILIFSQVLLNIFINNKDFSSANSVIEDNEKLLLELNQQIKITNINEISEFVIFNNFWKSHLYRYRAILLLEQGQFIGSAEYIIKAIQLNPYYPYANYEIFKVNFIKRYSLELTYSVEDKTNELGVENPNNLNMLRAKIQESISFKEIELNSEILLNIIKKDQQNIAIKFIENQLTNLNSENPAILLIKADVCKYLPDNSPKINQIYYGRIDEAVSYLNKIIELDNNFTFIKTKIGALLINKSLHTKNVEEIEAAIKTYSEGKHFLTEVGFKS